MCATNAAQLKRALRAELKHIRHTLPHRRARQRLIDAALKSILCLQDGARIAVYSAIGDEARVDVLMHRLNAQGLSPIFPRVNGTELEFASCAPSELRAGFKGILEPPPQAPRVHVLDLQALLLPGLGFTCRGERLGYGGGFYDRTLHTLKTHAPHILRVAVGFEAQVVTQLPTEAHDIPVTHLLTEWGFRPCCPHEGVVTWGPPMHLKPICQ